MSEIIEYKISYVWSDGVARAFPTWDEIHNRISNFFGGAAKAHTAFVAYTREREGWDLTASDKLSAHQWRAVLEDTFSKISRPACAVVVVRAIRKMP